MISAHEDKKIRFFDINSGKLVYHMVAHQDACTNLAMDPTCFYLLSSSNYSYFLKGIRSFYKLNSINKVTIAHYVYGILKVKVAFKNLLHIEKNMTNLYIVLHSIQLNPI